MSDGRTHYEGCWRHHHDCAISMVERMREAIDWYLATYGNGDARDTTIGLSELGKALAAAKDHA